ncbi:unnamed protein product [Rotaria socialis]|uniref:Ig-like domain-containing protein n=1 Tax=Rotaria socialis TaxID=392032 RepID=A0A818NWB1_9BILA|nr:unnamed protein product [Rotaria socialis]
MECQARGRPKPYITWFRRINSGDNQTKSESQLLTNNTNGQLHLFNISRSQIGHYECRASNGVNGHVVSKDIELRVLCKIMTSWFVILNLTLLLSSSFLQARFRTYSKRRYVPSNKPFYQPISSDDNSDPMVNDDSLIESATGKVTKNLKNQASEQQIEQFARLLFDRLNLKEPPNVTVEINLEADSPPPFVKQLEQEYLKTKEQQDQSRDESQAVTERAVLPGARISSYTCQRQISAQLNIKHDNLKNIDCFKFSKSPLESASLPTNQIAQQLRVYIKKNFFVLNEQQEDLLAPDMFQIYQVFRPTSNDTSIKPSPSLKDTMRLPISQIKELNDNWLELTIDPNNEKLTIEQIYQQFITPWYGLAINHQLKASWPPSYRSYPSENRFERSNDDEDNSEESKEQQLLYMLVEYSSKLRSSSTGHRSIRSNSKPRPAKPCDPKSPCCRRSLIIDLDQGNNVLDFVIHPRQFDIGECVGSCDTSGSSLQYTQAKNDQQKNKPHAAYSLVFLHRHGRNNNSLTATRNHRADRESSRCCSFSRTGGLELTYTTTNDGPIIKKYIPNMIVESFPPLIQAPSAILQSSLGKSIQLRCSAVAPFDTKIYWHRIDNNTTIKFRQQQQQQTAGDVIQTVLYLKEIDKTDFGLYNCIADSKAGQSHATIQLREYRRSTNSKVIENNDLSTSRMPMLKRNKISDQITMSIETSQASSCFSLLYLSFTMIQIILYNLT